MPNGARARPSKANLRPDHNGPQRAQFESNKKKIYATQKVCGKPGTFVQFRNTASKKPYLRENSADTAFLNEAGEGNRTRRSITKIRCF